MSISKKSYLVFVFFLNFIFLISNIFSVCDYNPEYVEIKSGTSSTVNHNLGDDIYIKADLSANPLKITYVFNNTDNNCLNLVSDVTTKLFVDGSYVDSSSISTTSYNNNSYYITRAVFNFNPSVVITSPFTTSYLVKASNSGSFMFYPDTEVPTLNYVITNSKAIYPLNEVIKIDYNANDLKSGLKTVRITGDYTSNNNLNSENSFSNNFSLTLVSTKTVSFYVEDILGNSISESKTFIVDSSAPTISNLNKVYSYTSNVRYVTISVVLTDISFNYTTDSPIILGNFSSINQIYSNQLGNCARTSSTTYLCTWNNLILNLDSTQNVNFKFSVSDSLSNSVQNTVNTEIFVDKTGPEILDFHLENGYGQTNIFRPTDNNAKVYMTIKDSSFALNMSHSILYDFDLVSMIAPACSKNSQDNTQINCVWSLGNSLMPYTNYNLNKSVVFSAIVSDEYRNTVSQNITITIDKSSPIFKSVEIIETESIKDSIIKSNENFNFKVFLNEENILVNGSYNVYGKLSTIDTSIISDIRGNCQRYNETTVQCDFNGINARNGYVNTSAIFYAIDSAGNYNNISYRLEILKIGNETPDAYRVIDNNKYNSQNKNEFVLILNPVNRDMLHSSGVDAWFKGKIIPLDSNSKYSLVNYALKECSWESENPIISNGEILFGATNNVKIYKKTGDDEFAIKVKLHDHPNYNDMNDMYMNCTLSIVKRDNQTIYGTNIGGAEEVNFKLKFSFYANPRGDLLKANAAKVIEMIEETEVLGSWFDTTYKIYNVLNGICTVVNNGAGMLTTANEIITLWQASTPGDVVFSGGTLTGAAQQVSSNAQSGLMFHLTNPKGFVKKACNFVTCEYGGLISTEALANNVPGVSQIMDLNNKACEVFSTPFIQKKEAEKK